LATLFYLLRDLTWVQASKMTDGWLIFLGLLIPTVLGATAYAISAAYAAYKAWQEARRRRQSAGERDVEAGGAGGAVSHELR
jgi:hypothetical protein